MDFFAPPIGVGRFIISAMTDVPISKIFSTIYPFLLFTVIVLVLLILQPWLITTLLK